MTASDTASYLYAVGHAPLPDAVLTDVAGVHDGPVRTVAEGTLAAVVQSVPRDEFGPEALERRLGDIAEVERLVRAHHRVVQAVGAGAAVVPMRLATLYADDDGVRRVLRDEAGRLDAALARITGRAEWGVKAYSPPRTDRGRSAAGDGGTGPGAGREYLLRRRAERAEAERAHAELLQSVVELDADLRAVADDVRHLPPRPAPGAGDAADGETNVFNASYLVAHERTDAFGAALARWADSRLRLDVGGPWVPYSFTAPEEGSDSGGTFP